MDNPYGIKFGDLKKEEHYKRLERNLKLVLGKHMDKLKNGCDKDYCTSPTWPSLSTINPDGLDTSYAQAPSSLQVSRIGSEVVSSSHNLRKVLPVHKNDFVEHLPMTTSSVKKFSINNHDEDRAIMPPPSINSLRLTNPKRSCNTDSKYNQQIRRKGFVSETLDSSIRISSGTSNAHYQQDSNSCVNSDNQETKDHRIFSRWRVLLNDQGQLIIKGTLECGKIARSKPVIQRLANNRVQSIFKHIYVLNGSITDERHELPDYVRGKFCNGFPDDWENVYQIWRNYVAGGSQITFRWPTPITDDDDDLQSEITDITYFKNRQMEYKEQVLNSKSNGSSSGYYSKVQLDSIQNIEKVDNTAPEIQNSSRKTDDSINHLELKEINRDSQNASSNSSYSHLKNASYLYEVIREDKIPLILSHLGDKKCSPQYLDKFIDLIDCLKYILSYTPTSNAESNKHLDIQTQNCEKCSNTASFSETQEMNPEEQSKHVTDNLGSQQTEIQLQTEPMHNNNDLTSDSSDSEAYMGIPHISLNHLIKSKPPRSQRYRDRKNRSKERKNISKEKQFEREIESVPVKTLQNRYDSSVSITEDEHEKINQKQSGNPYLRNDTQENIRRNEICNERLKNYISKDAHERINQKQIRNPYSEVENQENIRRNEILNEAIRNYVPQLPLTPTKLEHRIPEKQKPMIKSCEQVNFDLNFKYAQRKQVPVHSDVSILDDVPTKKNKFPLVDADTNSNGSDNHEDKLRGDMLMHPFLTYDSEDFIEEDIDNKDDKKPLNNSNDLRKKQSVKMKSRSKTDSKRSNDSLTKQDKNDEKETGQKTPSLEIKKVKNDPFGSKENPKLLTSWVPCVACDDEFKKKCSLKFEGKLLNEAGHILNRKFMTESIRQRHTAKLIETIDNEFFMLVGDINDTKHVVPRELIKLCRTGCPSKIKEFCEEWKLSTPVLEKATKSENLHEISIDTISMPTSSRGRKIAPPLDFWNGERLTNKDGDVVYKPGHVHKSLTMSEQRPRKEQSKENGTKISKSSSKAAKVEDKTPSVEQKIKPAKKRIAQKLKYSSSSETDKDEPSNNKNTRQSKPPSKEKQSTNLQIKMNSKAATQVLTETAYNKKLRKRQKVELKEKPQESLEPPEVKAKAPRKKQTNLVWTYQKGPQCYDNILSDDQVSVIIK